MAYGIYCSRNFLLEQELGGKHSFLQAIYNSILQFQTPVTAVSLKQTIRRKHACKSQVPRKGILILGHLNAVLSIILLEETSIIPLSAFHVAFVKLAISI